MPLCSGFVLLIVEVVLHEYVCTTAVCRLVDSQFEGFPSGFGTASLRPHSSCLHPKLARSAQPYRCHWPTCCCDRQVVAVKLRSGHQHTAVCVGSLPCSSDEERAASGKQAARKEFIIVASYCEHEGADDGGGPTGATGACGAAARAAAGTGPAVVLRDPPGDRRRRRRSRVLSMCMTEPLHD